MADNCGGGHRHCRPLLRELASEPRGGPAEDGGVPEEVIVSGGGARNTTLMAMLAQCLSPAHVTSSDEHGLGIEAKEAVAFAVLAYETWHKRPGNIPAATGASRGVVLGSLTY